MNVPPRQILGIAAVALALWVVPSLGSQGMGTIGQRFAHPDRDLLTETARDSRTAQRLHAADSAVEAALPPLIETGTQTAR